MENPNSWSELPLDLLNSVFERLGFADFQRGKSVCSSWYSASRQCVPKNQLVPWLILFPKHKSNHNSCMLFNPEEKHKLYKMQHLCCDFSESVCRATYGSWLLMQDPLYNLYILNIFTKERINLPPVESQIGTRKIERTSLDDDLFLISNDQNRILKFKGIDIRSPVFWIDDRTKDYVVIWGLRGGSLVYSKRGDEFWKQIPEITLYFDLVYKDHKLYFSFFHGSFGIFDFSGEIPQQTFFGILHHNVRGDPYDPSAIMFTKLVVTLTGDVLRVVKRLLPKSTGVSYFYVYKVYSSGSLMYERLYSLGNEAVLFDLGITVLANDTEGLKKNSIYFNIGSSVNDTTEICLFNLQTHKMEPIHKFDSLSFQLSTAQWFLPKFHA